MITLSPSILSADFANLGAHCRTVLDAGAGMLHFDVMDGHFVPNISFGVPVLASLHKALPDAFYDVHLMISDPVTYAPAFARAGASCITFHVEAVQDVPAAIRAIRDCGVQAGISLKPGTPVESVFPLLPLVDMVLFRDKWYRCLFRLYFPSARVRRAAGTTGRRSCHAETSQN